jgi:hypothetical protein
MNCAIPGNIEVVRINSLLRRIVMTNRVLLMVNRVFDGAGEAMSTPSGVNVDLLRSYGRHPSYDVPHFYGNQIPTQR